MSGVKLVARQRWQLAAAATVLAALVSVVLLAGVSSAATRGDSTRQVSGTLYMMTGSAPGSDAGFAAVNAAFEKAYPGVKVDYTSLPNAQLKQAEAARLTAGNIDILAATPQPVPSYTTGADTADNILANHGGFVTLNGQKFLKRFLPSVLAAAAYKGHDYVLPTGISFVSGVYYNKSIFAKYHLSVPTTWKAFVTVCKTLQAHGVTPIGIGGKDGWPAGLPVWAAVNGRYPTTVAKQQLAKGLWNGTVKLTDAKNETIMEQTQVIYGFAEPNFAGVPYNDLPSLFANGSFAMVLDGTWNNVTELGAVGSNFQVGFFPLPTSQNPQDNALLNGKLEIRLAIASNGPNTAAALAYFDFFSRPANYKLFLASAGFSPTEPNIPLSPFLQSISKYTKVFRLNWQSIWTSDPKAGTAALFPFNYRDVKPFGTQSAGGAALLAQTAWAAAGH